MSIETSENRPLLSQINTQIAVADPMDDVIVDRNDMRRGSDFAERRHTSGKVVDRIEALESAARHQHHGWPDHDTPRATVLALLAVDSRR